MFSFYCSLIVSWLKYIFQRKSVINKNIHYVGNAPGYHIIGALRWHTLNLCDPQKGCPGWDGTDTIKSFFSLEGSYAVFRWRLRVENLTNELYSVHRLCIMIFLPLPAKPKTCKNPFSICASGINLSIWVWIKGCPLCRYLEEFYHL